MLEVEPDTDQTVLSRHESGITFPSATFYRVCWMVGNRPYAAYVDEVLKYTELQDSEPMGKLASRCNLWEGRASVEKFGKMA